MKAFFRGVLKGILFCVFMLAAAFGLACFAGLIEPEFPAVPVFEKLADIRGGEAEVPHVYVVEPKEAADSQEEAKIQEEEANKADEEGEASGADASEAVSSEEEEISLLFAGDLFLTDLLQSKYGKQGISAAASEELLALTQSADIFMVNQEFPFGTTGEAAADKQYTFRVNPSYVSVLTDLGVDIVTLANNHMLDFGRSPLTETLEILDETGIAHVGAGENLEEAKAWKTFEKGGKTIGFLGASRVIPEHSWNASLAGSGVFTTYDPAALVAQIEKAKEHCDFVVVYVHWGIERSTTPEEYQKSMARQYIDAGADAVIGAHPHVLQGIEYYQGKPICYSLGNFIFSNGTYQTMAAKLCLSEEGTQLRLWPCASEANQMRLLSAAETEAFYRELEALSFGVSVSENGIVSEQ